MNDNEPHDDYVDPEWAWEIVEKHDLALRANTPIGAARALITDAGRIAQEIVDTAFREQAFSPSTKRRLRAVIDMLTDAERMSTLCDDEPSLSIIKTMADGWQTWEPAAERSLNRHIRRGALASRRPVCCWLQDVTRCVGLRKSGPDQGSRWRVDRNLRVAASMVALAALSNAVPATAFRWGSAG